ncbi:MAG: hypothetical protein LBM26_03605, partial [Methanobrevibacter sp.]|nr:hypothetical protein [Methanobrevibacter sp.]
CNYDQDNFNDYNSILKSDEIDFENKLDKIVYDLGSGSGVLSYFSSFYFKSIIAIEKDHKIANYAENSLKNVKNIKFLNKDALNYNFNTNTTNFINNHNHCYNQDHNHNNNYNNNPNHNPDHDMDNKCSSDFKADLIICEMLDTALIDEEEVLVLNHFHKFLKDDGEIIPKGIINIAEPIHIYDRNNRYNNYYDDETDNVVYKPKSNETEHSHYKIIGGFVKYSEFDFSKKINPYFKTIIQFKIDMVDKIDKIDTIDKIDESLIAKSLKNNSKDKNSKDKNLNDQNMINGIKITTFTKLNDNIICGPTPMLNPPLIVPLENSYSYYSSLHHSSLSSFSSNDMESNVNDVHNVNNDIRDNTINSCDYISNNKSNNSNNSNNSEVSIELKYIMGGGLETINAKIIKT